MSEPHIKIYPPHFDAPLTKIEAESIVSNSKRVSRHPFFPFLQRNQHWTKYADKGKQPEEKTRPIRYASRRDSYIYSYYREILNPLYEHELQRLALNDCVLAYRRIPQPSGRGGKCNIHFADQVFRKIRELGNCYVFALDISQFFEHLDHEQIRNKWWRLLGKPVSKSKNALLPDDHFQVFKAVTRYSFIDRDSAYKALGLIGEEQLASGRKRIKYLVKREDFPKQICTTKDFRNKLTGIMEHNLNPFGIPQGSPISDLLANLYMIDFDDQMNRLISSKGGVYYRYSDDILIILPAPIDSWKKMISLIKAVLNKTAARLKLKNSKTQVYQYCLVNGGPDQDNKILNATSGTDGLEYLGFRYDGKRVFLRNSTVSGNHRKMTAVAKRMARQHVEKFPTLSLNQLIQTFNYEILITKFGRVKEFSHSNGNYRSWTFWTYAKRSREILGELGVGIAHQVKNYKALARSKAKKAIEFAYNHRR
jgi:hypothetical protein